MDSATGALLTAHNEYARAAIGGDPNSRPPIFKVVGIILAISSGLFIGVSFVLKKVGLLKANVKYNEEAGEGYGYLKNFWWWGGMTLMIIGEVCNFVAYAFVDAILVTPMGALSVVVTAILSAIFLKERLSFVGKVGCFNCIIGSVVIVINVPTQAAVNNIQDMKRLVLAPGFLSFAGVIIVVSVILALWAGPRWGKQSMFVYLTICSLIGGLSVVATQGLGAAVVAQPSQGGQFSNWFLWVLLVFVVITLLTEIIYLNKALNLFNAALVTPTYYVFFTSSTIVTSAVLFQGFKGTPASISTVVMGFLQICSGVVLLQLSKSAKDVPDTAVFKGDLDQVRTVAEQEEPEYEPRADTIRGSAAILRSISTARQKKEAQEAKHIQEELMQPIREDEPVEWDGLRRRRTIIGAASPVGGVVRRKSVHPPLGMSQFPDPEDHSDNESLHPGFINRLRSLSKPKTPKSHTTPPVPMSGLRHVENNDTTPFPTMDGAYSPSSGLTSREHIYGLPTGLRRGTDHLDEDTSYKPHHETIHWSEDVPSGSGTHAPGQTQSAGNLLPPNTAKRQFSFSNVFHRHKSSDGTEHSQRPTTSRSALSFGSKRRDTGGASSKNPILGEDGATEEERLGLVKGDSRLDVTRTSMSAYRDDDAKRTLSEESDDSPLEQGPPAYMSDPDEEQWQMPRRLGDGDSQVSPGSRSGGTLSPRRGLSDEGRRLTRNNGKGESEERDWEKEGGGGRS